jgi:2-polyprenyl-6-methoxyphenol hydroxylase-like FAD-dependent oxidoreductase
MARTVKVAVIGTGLAGLTAAYLLAQSSDAEVDFEVHVFDKVRIVTSSSHIIALTRFSVVVLGHGLVLHLAPHSRHKEGLENRRTYAFVSRRYVSQHLATKKRSELELLWLQATTPN